MEPYLIAVVSPGSRHFDGRTLVALMYWLPKLSI